MARKPLSSIRIKTLQEMVDKGWNPDVDTLVIGLTSPHRDGYDRVWVIRDQKVTSMPLHRLVMERSKGRRLTSEEIVHHKNLNKRHNNIENLQVMTPEAHRALHAKLKAERKKLKKERKARQPKRTPLTGGCSLA